MKENIGRGRPTKLTDEKIELAIKLRERGFSIEEIANALKISEALLYLKNTEWERLRNRLNIIKEKQELERIEKVEKSLFKRSIGYKTKEKKENYDKSGELLGYTITTKEVSGDVKAQTLFLTNRAPDRWKVTPEDKQDTEVVDNQIVIKIED